MPAPAGNQFWKLRSKHGRDKLFATPDLLWEAACEYFEWVDTNPWFKVEQAKGAPKPIKNDEGEYEWPPNLIEIPTARPYTIKAFLLYIGTSESYWKDFKKANHEGFSSIIETIEYAMYSQKFEGAATGAFNANIIARDLGLSDKKELTGKDGEKLIPEQPAPNMDHLTIDQIEELLKKYDPRSDNT